jgi:hypothetical protein
MSRIFIIPGQNYHPNKDQFKKIMKDAKLKWSGTMDVPKWTNGNSGVLAKFIRDKEKDITIEGQFVVNGEGPAIDKICQFIIDVFKGVENSPGAENISNSMITERLKLFDMIHRPNVEILKSRGAPKSFIDHEIKVYKEKRNKIIKEMGGEVDG